MTVTAVVAPAADPDEPRITLSTPADLVAATPYLLHFHPANSVVVLAFRDRSLVGSARVDLPDHPDDVSPIAQALADTMADQGASLLAFLGYGPANRVDPVVPAIRAAAERRGLRVKDVLRVDAGRWWCYTCHDPGCCPPEGTPFDSSTSEVAARFAFEGMVALPSRGELERRVAPLDGPARLSIAQATDRAEAAFLTWQATVPEPARAEAVLAEGTAAVHAAIARYAEGGTLDDDELARLTILLVWLPVRDVAWQAISTEEPHLSLWTDVVRRADLSLAVAPASLLAFTAWCHGNSVLAELALERALAEDPSYTMANLVLRAVRSGPPAPCFQDWGTPRWEQRLDSDPHQPERPPSRSRKSRLRKAARRKTPRSKAPRSN